MKWRAQEWVPFHIATGRWRSTWGAGLGDKDNDWSCREIESTRLGEKEDSNRGSEREFNRDEEDGGDDKGRGEGVESKGIGMASKSIAGNTEEVDGGDDEVSNVGIGDTIGGEDMKVKYLVSSSKVTSTETRYF